MHSTVFIRLSCGDSGVSHSGDSEELRLRFLLPSSHPLLRFQRTDLSYCGKKLFQCEIFRCI